jgi:hypothetical protein
MTTTLILLALFMLRALRFFRKQDKKVNKIFKTNLT